jgi:hypothetical protein
MTNKHLAMVDAVNDAKTQAEHDMAYWRLSGFREGLEACGRSPNLIGADLHSMERFGEHRPICCGVLLDWKPQEVAA